MSAKKFEWDEEKAAANFDRHGVSFETAKKAFDDPFALEYQDDRSNYGEERYILLAIVDERLLFVVYTMRDEIHRIISARGALPNERRKYHEQDF